MKRILSILFLSLFLYLFTGYYFYFSFTFNDYKNTETSISVFKLSKTDFNKINWKKHNKEFIYKNKLYDVKSINVSGDNIVLKCLSDKEETLGYKKLNLVINNFVTDKTSSKNQKKLTFNIFKPAFFNNVFVFTFFNNNINNSIFYFKTFYRNFIKDIIPPPPKF